MSSILAIDSSIGISSAAILRDGKLLAYLENRESGMQSAKLVPLIEETLKAASIQYADLTTIACTTGPGSFTGIRISMATARAIAFGLNIPSLGFTTLEVMAAATKEPKTLAILNAGKGEVFFQYFGDVPGPPAIGSMEEALAQANGYRISSSMALPQGYITPTITFPRADALAQLAFEHPDQATKLKPFYIRPPDAKPQRVLSSGG